MKTAWLLCQLLFCTDATTAKTYSEKLGEITWDIPEECEPMRETLKEYPSLEAAQQRRDQMHRSNQNPCRIEPERSARWKCEVSQ